MDFYNSRFAMLFCREGHTQWAVTMPWGTHYSVPKEKVTPRWRRHERRHLWQWWRLLIIGFAILYPAQLAIYGYENMPLEVEARAAAEEGTD